MASSSGYPPTQKVSSLIAEAEAMPIDPSGPRPHHQQHTPPPSPPLAPAFETRNQDNVPSYGSSASPPPAAALGPVPAGDAAPTVSHALATADHEEKGVAQVTGEMSSKLAANEVQRSPLKLAGETPTTAETGTVLNLSSTAPTPPPPTNPHPHISSHPTATSGTLSSTGTSAEVKDLGWHAPPQAIPAPLVGGLPNEELWTLIRRFDKQMYHVKAIPHMPPGGLDLNISPEEEFSPDKLRGAGERLYMTVIIGVIAFVKHIARLRSWKEKRRTTAFAAAYFLAWTVNLVMPLLLTTLLTLIIYPPSRSYLFPPAPLALVDASTGGIKNPVSGVLGTHNSLTGAPEAHHGEAVEQEAHNFVKSFGMIAITSAAGKNPEHPMTMEEHKTKMDSKDVSEGGDARTHGGKDKAKKPMEEAMWEGVRPAMRAVNDLADLWERIANALSPTPPFPRDAARIRIAAMVVMPTLVASVVVTPQIFIKASQFIFGFAFFGQPVFDRALAWLDRKVPHWKEFLDIRNTILKSVPTNAQLTLTLLRVGEANKAPLPPPPTTEKPAEDTAAPIDTEALPVDPDAHPSDLHAAIHPDPHNPGDTQTAKQKKHPKTNKIMSFFKGTAKTGVNTALSTDHLKASVGSVSAKNRLGAVPPPTAPPPDSGPVEFPCRYMGKKGTLNIIISSASPCVSFKYQGREGDKNAGWVVPIGDITELRKVGGLGWKSKMVVGWSLEREVLDGLEIVARRPGGLQGEETNEEERWLVTAVGMRDRLFNRLVAIGAQVWESW